MNGRIVAVALVVVAAGGLALRSSGDRSERPTASVRREEFRVVVEATGSLEAAVSFEIGPPSMQDFWEYNLSWMIPEGTMVKAGDVIARFDATSLEDQLRDHRATLEKVQQEREKEQRSLDVSLRELRLDLVKAEGELKTVDLDLSVPQELVSSIELEQNRLRRDLARTRVEFLREKVEFSKALVDSQLELLDVKARFSEGKIAYLEKSLEKFNVRAPVSGLVVYIPKRNGDRWEVGEGVWMLAKIMKIADVSTLEVNANVLEVDAARIDAGQAAEVTVDAIPGMTIRSQVAEVGRIVHERSLQDPSKVFDAILPLGPDVDTSAMRPGMGVQVRIETERQPDRLTIPVEAVRASPEGPYVEVRERGGAVRRRPVVLGAHDADRVVVESGLEEHETVLLGAGTTT